MDRLGSASVGAARATQRQGKSGCLDASENAPAEGTCTHRSPPVLQDVSPAFPESAIPSRGCDHDQCAFPKASPRVLLLGAGTSYWWRPAPSRHHQPRTFNPDKAVGHSNSTSSHLAPIHSHGSKDSPVGLTSLSSITLARKMLGFQLPSLGSTSMPASSPRYSWMLLAKRSYP